MYVMLWTFKTEQNAAEGRKEGKKEVIYMNMNMLLRGGSLPPVIKFG